MHARRRAIHNAARRGFAVGVATMVFATALLTAGLAPGGAAGTRYYGSAAGVALNAPIVDIAPTPSGNGYWLLSSDGGIFAFGDAGFFGSTGWMHLNAPIVGMAPTPSGRGYWIVASDGGIFTFGDAQFFGSTGWMHLNAPIVGIAPTPTGRGYLLVASDGGIFTFGDAKFRGSTGGMHLTRAIVGIATTKSGDGYWLVASDGGVFTFGGAQFAGSTGGRSLNSPIVGIAADPDGSGYWLVAQDGGIFTFGGAAFLGSAGSLAWSRPIVAMAAPASGGGYWLATSDGAVHVATTSGLRPDPKLTPSNPEQAIAQELFERMNAERRARGLAPLVWDGRLAGTATAWADHMAGSSNFAHQNLSALFSDSYFAGRYSHLRENIFVGNGSYRDSGSTHVALMRSDSHRATTLTPELQVVGIGVSCAGGRLWVTEDFAVLAPNTQPARRAIPPVDPIARPDQNGAGCP